MDIKIVTVSKEVFTDIKSVTVSQEVFTDLKKVPAMSREVFTESPRKCSRSQGSADNVQGSVHRVSQEVFTDLKSVTVSQEVFADLKEVLAMSREVFTL